MKMHKHIFDRNLAFKKPLVTASMCAGFVLSGMTIWIGCKPHSNSTRNSADSTNVERAFAWEASDLPICYHGREGTSYYVWRMDRTVQCNTSKGQWE